MKMMLCKIPQYVDYVNFIMWKEVPHVETCFIPEDLIKEHVGKSGLNTLIMNKYIKLIHNFHDIRFYEFLEKPFDSCECFMCDGEEES